jgi:hypothetical protein
MKLVAYSIALLLLAPAAAQSSKAATKPQLGESFAKAGLKAVVVINNEPGSDRAKASYDDAEVEHDRTNPNELLMLINLQTFKVARSDGPLPPSCSIGLEDAFRSRTAISLPDSCKK